MRKTHRVQYSQIAFAGIPYGDGDPQWWWGGWAYSLRIREEMRGEMGYA